MSKKEKKFKPHGTIRRKRDAYRYPLYEHQKEAMVNLSLLDRELTDFSTLVVIPTGGGKTRAIASWLLRNAIDKRIKVMWVAHTHELLEQAANEFRKYAYGDVLTKIESFTYRVISGKRSHDDFSDIKPNDSLLVLGVQSLAANMGKSKELESWLAGEGEMYLVIDEAHHTPARTYRDMLSKVPGNNTHRKLIGITATPFRTRADETSYLGQVFVDGVLDGVVRPGESVVAYAITLNELIRRGILAEPDIDECKTGECFDANDEFDWETIQEKDNLPDSIKKRMAENVKRNEIIVNQYLKFREKYGQTIVFVLTRDHAVQLNRLFLSKGVKSAFVISNQESLTSTVKGEKRKDAIDQFKDKEIEVLIGVNKLTEGVDLPETQTVFLARPTSSDVLMTQMVGRALRGPAAGGTKEAFIVAFDDDWSHHISWSRPVDIIGEVLQKDKRRYGGSSKGSIASIEAIEAYSEILSSEIAGRESASAAFTSIVPIGAYVFSLVEYPELESADIVERPCRILVYNSTAEAWATFMDGIGELCDGYLAADDIQYFNPDINSVADLAVLQYFNDNVVPPYDADDVKHALKYYVMTEQVPSYYSFESFDSSQLDTLSLAQDIVRRDLKTSERWAYVNRLWEEDSTGLLHDVYKQSWIYDRIISTKAIGILHPEVFKRGDSRLPEEGVEYAPLDVIEELDFDYYMQLNDAAYSRGSADFAGYECIRCGHKSVERSSFKVMPDVPLSYGGLSKPDNMVLMCKSCSRLELDGIPYCDDEDFYYVPNDLACFINAKDLGFRESIEFLDQVYNRENERLLPEHRYGRKGFFRDVMDAVYYYHGAKMTDDVYTFATCLRFEKLYFSEDGLVLVTLRQLLDAMGRKRRSDNACRAIDHAFWLVDLELRRHGGFYCDLESVDLDEELDLCLLDNPDEEVFDNESLSEFEDKLESLKALLEERIRQSEHPFELSGEEQEELEILQRTILKPRKHERKNDFDAVTRVRQDKDYVVLFCEGLLVAAYSRLTRKVYLVSHEDDPVYCWSYPTSRARRVREFVGQMRHIRYLPAKDELPYESYATEVTLLSGANVHEDVGDMFDQFDLPYR